MLIFFLAYNVHDRPNRLHTSRMTLHTCCVLILPGCKEPGGISNPRPRLTPEAALRAAGLAIKVKYPRILSILMALQSKFVKSSMPKCLECRWEKLIVI